jgi:hypothetical protein
VVSVVAFAFGLTAISAIAITPKSAIKERNIFIVFSHSYALRDDDEGGEGTAQHTIP